MRRQTTPPPRPTGSIRRDEVLPLAVFRQRIGIGSKGFAEMRKAGLPVRRFGRQAYLLGADIVSFFANLPPDGAEGASHD